MGTENLAVHLAAVAVSSLELTAPTVEARTIALEPNPAIAPESTVHFTPDAHLAPWEQVTVSPLSQAQIPPWQPIGCCYQGRAGFCQQSYLLRRAALSLVRVSANGPAIYYQWPLPH